MFEEHFNVPKTRNEKHQRNRTGGPKGDHSPGLDHPARGRLQGGGVDVASSGPRHRCAITLLEERPPTSNSPSTPALIDSANRHARASGASPRGTTRSASFPP